jgi:uncharacterized damage-inducible protein DinB
MNGVQALRSSFENAHNWYNGTIADVTPAQANYLPVGIAHPVGELIAHIVHSEDAIINGMLQGKAPLWDTQGWGKKTGLPNMMLHDTMGKGPRAFKADPAVLSEYSKAVQAQTLAYVSSLSDSSLDEKREYQGFGVQSRAFILQTLLANTLAHTGEISALKGLQGAKGYPF